MPSPVEIFAIRVAQEGKPMGGNVYAVPPDRGAVLLEEGERQGAEYIEEGADQYLEFEDGEVVELLPREVRDPRFRVKLPDSIDLDQLFRDGAHNRAPELAPSRSGEGGGLARNVAIGGVVVLVVAGLSAAAWWLWKKKQNKEGQRNERNAGTPVGTSGP